MSEPATLDPVRLRQLRELAELSGAGIVRELFEVFLREAPGLLERLGQAARASDARVLEDTAHRLKGASLSAGAGSMAETCRRIEALGRASRLEGALELCQRLEGELTRTTAEMRELIRADEL
ncbi:MAG: Hpt domain-containing protein [Candidatus Wallbacteria bacterium]|nr:Hpt domain-containing protein [Candidatus Wallbacteria bacterium]